MIDQRLYEQFRDIGRDIFDAGLTSSHGGNLSMRVGDRIIIKRRGAQFRRLKPEDFVETQLYKKDVSTQACPQCSAEGHDIDARHCKYCGAAL